MRSVDSNGNKKHVDCVCQLLGSSHNLVMCLSTKSCEVTDLPRDHGTQQHQHHQASILITAFWCLELIITVYHGGMMALEHEPVLHIDLIIYCALALHTHLHLPIHHDLLWQCDRGLALLGKH